MVKSSPIDPTGDSYIDNGDTFTGAGTVLMSVGSSTGVGVVWSLTPHLLPRRRSLGPWRPAAPGTATR